MEKVIKFLEKIVACLVAAIFFGIVLYWAIAFQNGVSFMLSSLSNRQAYCKEGACETAMEDIIEETRQNVFYADNLENKFVEWGIRSGAGGLGGPQVNMDFAEEFLFHTSEEIPVFFSFRKDDRSYKIIKTYWGLISPNDPRLVVYEKEYSCDCNDFCEFVGPFGLYLRTVPTISEDKKKIICKKYGSQD